MDLIDTRIERASYLRFAVWFAALFAFSTWAFNMDSPWTRALEASGGALPETMPGIHDAPPARILPELDVARGDYLLWQALDLPYALMTLMASALGISLGLRKSGARSTFLRYLYLLPFLYLACELVENIMLSLFATELLSPAGVAAALQQFATTLKFAAGFPAMMLGLLGVITAILVDLVRRIKN